MGKGLSYWGIGVNYCWNYGPWMLLFHFIEYRLDQLNNKHTKTAVNSTIQFFKSRYQRKYLVKVWFFGPPTTKWHPCKIFCEIERKPWLIFSNFTNIRHLVYWKCIIWTKSDLPIINSVCKKVWFTINGLFFNFYLFHISKLQVTFVKKIFWKNHPFL